MKHQPLTHTPLENSRVLIRLFLFMVALFVVLFAGSALAAPATTAAPASLNVAAVELAVPTAVLVGDPDLGDAPDSTNHFGVVMEAYPGTQAHFPTVFDQTTGSPPGPKHLNRPLHYHLGPNISSEREADIGGDMDGINNIVPSANNPNNDNFDDSITSPGAFPHCQLRTITYNVTVIAGGTSTAYFNLYLDWNRNGQWGDTPLCPNGSFAPEWAVQNQLVTFPGPGSYTITSPVFTTFNQNPQQQMWLRAILSDAPATTNNGSGPINGYQFGETEDYRLPGIIPTVPPTPVGHDGHD